MSALLEAFLLGNGAILTNVCILPLYPGLMAFLAGNVEGGNQAASPKITRWLGLLVLAGVLSMMLLVGGLLFALQQSFGAILPFVLPLIYVVVIVLGVLMLFGKNPFARLSSGQIPVLNNPIAGAYVYGLLLGPMTLPCAGPIVVTAFLLGTGSNSNLVSEIAYFLAFGLGFGWPLVLLPFLALPLQRRFTRWMTQNYRLLTAASGVLLIGIGLLGFYAEVLPMIRFG